MTRHGHPLCKVVLLLSVMLAWSAGPFHPEGEAGECPPCPCPTAPEETDDSVPEDGPETVTIDVIEDLYGPVEFTHLFHAEIADACTDCHHHDKPGVYQPCRACHQHELFDKPEKLNLPNLKGAYHRQCVDCHVDMAAGPIECAECHVLKATGSE